ncbi:co-chaperone GroES [Halanaerobacter jeridensis]|uniref:Co-chaperonin GroES n=1 Tax=Halanaerobacter jeridensis TaxID=706427 RepID=A0A938XVM1_9FIRM|nr:co-chaperone GroES [Halanaerobacter jeridensis]MBM7557659.1 chaperonin GroES [Halanaerobacter jeridensis]
MDIKPLGDRVVIQKVEAKEEKTKGGIVIPDSAQEEPQEGKVVAVGPGKKLDNGEVAEPEVAEGDVVIYNDYAGKELKRNGKEYLVVSESDILAIVE